MIKPGTTQLTEFHKRMLDMWRNNVPAKQIAAIEGVKVGTITSQIARLRDKLGDSVVPRRMNNRQKKPVTRDRVPCILCRVLFNSEDRTRYRKCDKCKARERKSDSSPEPFSVGFLGAGNNVEAVPTLDWNL